MDVQRGDVYEGGVASPAPGADRVVAGAPAYGDRLRPTGYAPAIGVSENVLPVRNRVQWGPILAGTAISLVSLLLLALLGLAVGASAFEPGTDASDWGTAAGIWGAISVIIALFLGGWVAAKTAAVGGLFGGLMNGLVTGALTLILVLWMTTSGLTNLIGFVGNNASAIAAVTASNTNITPSDVNQAQSTANQAANQAAATLQDNYNSVQNGAWGTLIALVIALAAAAIGGLAGSNSRQELITGSSAG